MHSRSPTAPRSFRAWLVAGAVGVTVSVALALGALVFFQGRNAAERTAEAVLAQSLSRAEARILQLLRAAELTADTGSRLTDGRAVRGAELHELMLRAFGAFEQRPELTFLGFAIEATGEYALLERHPVAGVLLREYLVAADGRRVVRDYTLVGPVFRFDVETPWTDYDPRTRPFYRQVVAAGGPVWTETYPFVRRDTTSETLGVTYARPSPGPDGARAGVWDADFDLASIKDFLVGLENDTGLRLLLRYDPDPAKKLSVHGAAPAAFYDELDRVRGNASAALSHRVAGEDWRSARLVLPAPWPRWTLTVALPDRPVAGELLQSQRGFLLLAALASCLAVLAGLIFARRVAAPVEQLRRAVTALADNPSAPADFSSAASGPAELAALAADVRRMADAITARQRELAVANARLAAFLDHVPAELWGVSADGVCFLVNRQGRARWAGALGRRFEDLALSGAARAELAEHHRRAFAGESVRADVVETSPAGPRHYHRVVAPVRDERGAVTSVIGFELDITERRAAEDALRQSQLRLRSHFENTPLAVVDWSPDFTILSWNRAAEAIFGWSAAEVEGRNGLFMVPPRERPAVHSVWQELVARGRPANRNFNKNLTRDGAEIECEWYNTVLTDDRGRVVGVSSLVLDVSARHAAERLFRESEERFRRAFHANPTAAAINRSDGTFLDANDAWLRLFGFRREDIVGREGAGLLVWRDRAERARFLAALRARRSVRGFEAAFTATDGRRLSVLVSGVIIRFGGSNVLFSGYEDITDRQAAEAAVREGRRFHLALVASLPGLVARRTVADGFPLAYASEGALALTGYTAAELVALCTRDSLGLVHSDDRSFVHDAWRSAGTAGGSGSFFCEYRLVHRAGHALWVGERGTLKSDEHGGAPALVSFVADITARKHAESELREINLTLEARVIDRTSALAEANARLREVDRLKSEFLATMSHELRTPLNSIIGFSGVLRQGAAGPLNAEQLRQLGFVHGSARHLLSLINDLLDLSRIESGRMEIFPEPVPVAPLLLEIERTLAPIFTPKALGYRTVVPPAAASLVLHTDRKRLYQVLLNLAANAVKFTDRGEVAVELEILSDGGARIRVRDTGPGIAPDQLADLFIAFHQLDGSARRAHEGTGLGLYLVRKLLDLLGGTVAVDSSLGRGSVFTVVLPPHSAPSPRP